MQKFDVVIEAVRYKSGKIELVRAYERRGPSFSDRVLLDRKTLLERLKDGKTFGDRPAQGIPGRHLRRGKAREAGRAGRQTGA